MSFRWCLRYVIRCSVWARGERWVLRGMRRDAAIDSWKPRERREHWRLQRRECRRRVACQRLPGLPRVEFILNAFDVFHAIIISAKKIGGFRFPNIFYMHSFHSCWKFNFEISMTYFNDVRKTCRIPNLIYKFLSVYILCFPRVVYSTRAHGHIYCLR